MMFFVVDLMLVIMEFVIKLMLLMLLMMRVVMMMSRDLTIISFSIPNSSLRVHTCIYSKLTVEMDAFIRKLR